MFKFSAHSNFSSHLPPFFLNIVFLFVCILLGIIDIFCFGSLQGYRPCHYPCTD